MLQTTLADMASQAGTSTGLRIRTPELARLIGVLQAIPVAYRQTAPDTLVIDGATPEWFGPLAAQHQIVLYELVHERGSLEDVFLRLTHGFDAADPHLAGGQAAPFGATRLPVGARLRAEPSGADARGHPMIAGIRSEWLKLRTTAVPWVLAGIALLINGLLILVILPQPRQRRRDGNDGGTGRSASQSPTPPSSCATCSGSGFEGYLFALLLGMLMVTSEFRHKTVTTSFLVTPHRPRFVGAKLLTAAILGALLGRAHAGGHRASAAASPSPLQGGSFSALVRQIPAVAPGMILVFALFAILGVGVGSLLTNQVAAIIVCLGWFIILEGILVEPGPRRRQVGADRCRQRRLQPDPGPGERTSGCSTGGRAPCSCWPTGWSSPPSARSS